jgi:hypothetical protein
VNEYQFCFAAHLPVFVQLVAIGFVAVWLNRRIVRFENAVDALEVTIYELQQAKA